MDLFPSATSAQQQSASFNEKEAVNNKFFSEFLEWGQGSDPTRYSNVDQCSGSQVSDEPERNTIQDFSSDVLPAAIQLESMNLGNSPKLPSRAGVKAQSKRRFKRQVFIHDYKKRKQAPMVSFKKITEQDLLQYPHLNYSQLRQLKLDQWKEEIEDRRRQTLYSSQRTSRRSSQDRKVSKKPWTCGPTRKQPLRTTKCQESLSEAEIEKRLATMSANTSSRHNEPAGNQASDVQMTEVILTPEQQLKNQRKEQDPYFPIRLYDQADEDLTCDVCLEKSPEDDNEIVVCALCNSAVHQACNGGNLNRRVPAGDWLCDRCSELVKTRDTSCERIHCFLCNDLKGIMRKVTFGRQTQWAHILCVNWIPEIDFTSEEKNKISGSIDPARYTIPCSYCHKLNGAVIQCDFKECAVSAHPRCAIKKGMIFDMELMERYVNKDLLMEEDFFMPIFCRGHRIKGYATFKEKGKVGLLTARHRLLQKTSKKQAGSITSLTRALKQISKAKPKKTLNVKKNKRQAIVRKRAARSTSRKAEEKASKRTSSFVPSLDSLVMAMQERKPRPIEVIHLDEDQIIERKPEKLQRAQKSSRSQKKKVPRTKSAAAEPIMPYIEQRNSSLPMEELELFSKKPLPQPEISFTQFAKQLTSNMDHEMKDEEPEAPVKSQAKKLRKHRRSKKAAPPEQVSSGSKMSDNELFKAFFDMVQKSQLGQSVMGK